MQLIFLSMPQNVEARVVDPTVLIEDAAAGCGCTATCRRSARGMKNPFSNLYAYESSLEKKVLELEVFTFILSTSVFRYS